MLLQGTLDVPDVVRGELQAKMRSRDGNTLRGDAIRVAMGRSVSGVFASGARQVLLRGTTLAAAPNIGRAAISAEDRRLAHLIGCDTTGCAMHPACHCMVATDVGIAVDALSVIEVDRVSRGSSSMGPSYRCRHVGGRVLRVAILSAL